MMPELVEMPCSEILGAQSAPLQTGDGVHVPLCRENTIPKLLTWQRKP